ncbi:MAG: DUF3043 domain-containing protein [Nocardioidaceae bacterium]
MFRRRSSNDDSAIAPGSAGADLRADVEPGTAPKGKPTPKRKEAEAARKQRVTPPRSRKEASRIMREKRREERGRMQESMRTGDERHLPARDRGKVRRFCRDLVDARRSVGEYLLPLLVAVLVLSFIRSSASLTAVAVIWTVTIVFTVLDTGYLIWRTRKELRKRFSPEETRGAVAYTLLRSTQLRRFRMPKPQVKRGHPLSEPR